MMPTSWQPAVANSDVTPPTTYAYTATSQLNPSSFAPLNTW